MPQLTANKLVTNAYEAVKQLPGVIEQNDVLGNNSVSLIRNGTPSSMTYEQLISLLKSIPASRVKRAELMYSASTAGKYIPAKATTLPTHGH